MAAPFDGRPDSQAAPMPLRPDVHVRYPEILSFDTVQCRLAEFDTLIDVRSPSEFAEDHLPGAINCPVLNDAERQEVGTLYKQVNAFEAKKIGAAKVARNIGQYIESLFVDKPRDWRPLVYCWRGGNRSGAMAHVLAKIGWHVAQLDGGYKQYRHHVNQTMHSLSQRFRFKVVCGTTGSGKSRLLQILKAQGMQIIDLEQLAMHRGSVLGHLPNASQPSQKMFESQLWEILRSLDPERDVFIEAESKKVGNLRVPDTLMTAMRSAPCIALELPLEQRVALLMADYAHFVAQPEILNRQLDCLVSLYGKAKILAWQAMASAGNLQDLVTILLTEHYDPAYRRSIARNFTEFSSAMPLSMKDFSDDSFRQATAALKSAVVED